MEQFELLRYLVAVLEELDLEYFIAGSIATSYYGEPRFTNDIDVVVVLANANVKQFCESFPHEDFYLSEPAVFSAVDAKRTFNILQPATGLKVDVFVFDESDLEQSRLARRVRTDLGNGLVAWLSRAEDAILKKLIYYAEGNSEKHIRDILGVVKIQNESIDFDYLHNWTVQLGLSELWQDVLARDETKNDGEEDAN